MGELKSNIAIRDSIQNNNYLKMDPKLLLYENQITYMYIYSNLFVLYALTFGSSSPEIFIYKFAVRWRVNSTLVCNRHWSVSQTMHACKQ